MKITGERRRFCALNATDADFSFFSPDRFSQREETTHGDDEEEKLSGLMVLRRPGADS